MTVKLTKLEMNIFHIQMCIRDRLASRGARLESIQALAGHANIQTTMHYNEAAQLMSPASAIFDEE